MAIRKIVSRALTDSLNVDSGTLVVDDANNRVGIGTATPSVDLDIQSTGSGTKLNVQTTGSGFNVDLTDASATSRIRHVGTIFDLGADYTNTAVSDPRVRFRVGNSVQCSINGHGGIAFGNDTAAENTLDDYEEGTFTPTIIRSSSNPSYTASVSAGNYTKIGNVVHLQILIVVTAVSSSGSGNMRISGLPFSGATAPTYSHVLNVGYNDTFDSAIKDCYVSGFELQMIPTGITQSNYTGALSTGYLSISGTYLTS